MKDPDTSLSALIEACRQDDERAQFALYERFYAYTLTVSLHYCKNRMEAEEVVQDTFVKVFKALGSFKHQEAFKPWLRTIIVRTAINHYHVKRNWKNILSIDRLQQHPSVENNALKKLEEEELYRLLQSLSPAYRLVFNLHVLEGYSHPEIAKMLGISIGTSKSNLSKARRKIQRLSTSFFTLFRNSYLKS